MYGIVSGWGVGYDVGTARKRQLHEYSQRLTVPPEVSSVSTHAGAPQWGHVNSRLSTGTALSFI